MTEHPECVREWVEALERQTDSLLEDCAGILPSADRRRKIDAARGHGGG